jgi:hypothetical protein
MAAAPIELVGRVRLAHEPAEPSQRKIAQLVRLVPTKPFAIDLGGLETAVWYMPYGGDLAYFDADGRCVGFQAQPQRMTIELVLEYRSADRALEDVRAGRRPEPADLAAALDKLAPELRDWIVAMAAAQPAASRTGRPARHVLDLTHDAWRAEALYVLVTGGANTVGEALAIVADRHHVALGTVRNNVGMITKR